CPRGPIVIGNCYHVALRMGGLSITDQRSKSLQSVTVDRPSRTLGQMSSQLNTPARYVVGDALPLLLRSRIRLASRVQGTPGGIVVAAFAGGEGDAHSSAVQPVTRAT